MLHSAKDLITYVVVLAGSQICREEQFFRVLGKSLYDL